MPSIIPGYEYDIFISYRQNDNKRDGWVTEFINTLKDELEATVKDKLNIYFDEKLEYLIKQNGLISVELLKRDPFWDPLRGMNGFKAIINNPEYQEVLPSK